MSIVFYRCVKSGYYWFDKSSAADRPSHFELRLRLLDLAVRLRLTKLTSTAINYDLLRLALNTKRLYVSFKCDITIAKITYSRLTRQHGLFVSLASDLRARVLDK
ncbi:unnamed protein product [Leptosia nina]|uniref:Uncharacterized protein n=1 Tax=Leptosia nina TaxID=320188 RepID=A0AAV1JRL3_9NEOP